MNLKARTPVLITYNPEVKEIALMMGIKERHFAPLINVSIEQLVPQGHFYRHLERTLDLSFVREFVEKTYAGSGRPSMGYDKDSYKNGPFDREESKASVYHAPCIPSLPSSLSSCAFSGSTAT